VTGELKKIAADLIIAALAVIGFATLLMGVLGLIEGGLQ
jgi:hypothetical protein